MYSINKQKFLAELGRLLTFMYEEDRQTALSMYNRLFDMTDDEQALLQFLVSPTRQAVVLARKYDAAERKLHVHSQHRDPAQAGSADTPPFVLAIEKLEQEMLSVCAPAPVVDTDQLSLFEDEIPASEADLPAFEEELPVPEETGADGLFSLDAVDGASRATQAESNVRFSLDAVADETESPAPSAPAPFVAEEPLPAEEAEAPAPTSEERPAPAEEAEETEASEEQSAPADKVDAFLSDFSIKDELSDPAADAAPAPVEQTDVAVAVPKLEKELPPAPAGTVRKPRAALLILYIIAAAVVALVGVAVLLIPTLLSLSFAVVSGWAAFALMASAFGSFTMFADILAVFGVALIVFALALLFAWLFFWLIGGAICGLVRGLCRLGGKWCYKEVPAV